VVLWLATNQWAVATAVGLAASIGIGGLIFLFKLLTIPAKLAEEARAKLAIEDDEQVEIGRRRALISRLVDLYCMQMGDQCPPEIRAGLALPPEDWINENLGERGEGWQVFNIRGTSYQTIEMVLGEWRYRGYRMSSPAAVKWAAFLDALGLAWELGKEHLPGSAAPPDFYLPECKILFDVAYSKNDVLIERNRALARDRHEVVLLADGPPSIERDNLSVFGLNDHFPEDGWTWAEDRRDKGVFWLTQRDGSASFLLGGPGARSDHDREPIIGNAIKAGFAKAKDQPAPFEKLKK
jgi:hypothetical protein